MDQAPNISMVGPKQEGRLSRRQRDNNELATWALPIVDCWFGIVCDCSLIHRWDVGRHCNGELVALGGFKEQIFGVDDQVPGRGQTYLSGIGLTVMWEKQRTSTLLRPPQSEEAEFYPLCQLRPSQACPNPPAGASSSML